MIALRDITPRNIRKFIRYAWERRAFRPQAAPMVSAQALAAARVARGSQHRSAIMVHGIMPRAGTVYVGELLRLHPDIYAFPNHVWEFPFLQHADDVLDLQGDFLWSYEQNMDKIGPYDFLPLFGASLIAYLYEAVPAGKRMLLKVPSVEYLTHFYAVFPHEHLLVLTRDGRDLVDSTLKTWPPLRFSMVCMRWRRAARMVLAFDRQYRDQVKGYALARYEDVERDPAAFVRLVCQRFDLDVDRYPFDQISTVPVHGSSALRRKGSVTWNAQPKPATFKPVGRWHAWSAYKRWMFKRIAGRELMALGYCEDLNW